MVDAQFGDTNLAIVNWSQIEMLADEYQARQRKRDGKTKEKATRLAEHERAVRANRQLAVALQNQGLNEDAARFAYRAQILQRKVLWQQRTIGKWFFSLLLRSACRIWVSHGTNYHCLCARHLLLCSCLLSPWNALSTSFILSAGIS